MSSNAADDRALRRGHAGWFRSLAKSVAGLTGWRRSALAFGLGIAAAGGLPPAHGLPLLVIAFTGLAWLIAGSRSPWRAALAGWWFGFGHFLCGTYWIGAALLTDASRFGWMVAPAVIGLSAGFALFPAIAALAVRLCRLRGIWRIVGLAVAWTAVEWLRGHILTGFPMNLIGTTWTISDGMIQIAALTGAYGLSFITVLAAASPAAFADPAPGNPAPVAKRPWLFPAACLLLLIGIWVGGTVRLSLAEPGVASGPIVRIVQANIPQRLKWRDGARERGLVKHVRLSAADGRTQPDVILWPEAAVPFFLSSDGALRAMLGGIVPPGGLLITGAPRRGRDGSGAPALWNSLHAMDRGGRVLATYDKHHLVPFGEFVPLRNVLGLSKIVYGETDYSRGPGPQTIHLPGLPSFSPLICYEAIFPGQVVDDDDRPDLLLNITNDGWFGQTAGPHQHFQAARLRAVEEGLPLIRAANTGISAVIDGHGRVVRRLGLGKEGIIDAHIPTPLAGTTPYSRAGDWIVLAVIVGVIGVISIARLSVSIRQ